MSVRVQILAGALVAGLALTACDAVSRTTTTTTSEVTQAAPLTAAGTPTPLTPEPETDDSLLSAASVVRIDWVGAGSAKLFGTAGGDPAMNGLYTYIAFFAEPGGEWVIYNLGNILDYTVLASEIGSVDLDLHESVLNEATGEIGDRHRKVIVSWTPGDDGAPPTNVTVMPAQ